MNKKQKLRVGLVALASLGLVAGILAPAQGARNTIVFHETNPLTGFNTGQKNMNLTANTAVSYMSGIGFGYFNDKGIYIDNTIFGTQTASGSGSKFKIKYTVAPGRVFSDGTPITAVNLLFSHVTRSNAYAIAAGLGDPKSATASAFDSAGYSSIWNDWVVGDPVLSSDKMSATFSFKGKFADWKLYAVGPSAVHAMVHIADGKTSLQAVAANNDATDEFEKAFFAKDTAFLKKLATVYNTNYKITTVTSSTNPLLFVGNGGYTVSSAVDKQSVTMKKNPRYNSGPAFKGDIDTVVFRYITDGTAASQALSNGELDVYQGQVTADALAALKKISSIKVVGTPAAIYEHFDTRLGKNFNDPKQPEYNGPFAAKFGAKSKALRQAFLMCVPRQEIIDKLIKPFDPEAVVLGSTFTLPGSDIYDNIIRANGSKFYTGTQEELNKRARALIKKYAPEVTVANPLKIKIQVPGNNERRANQFALAKANMAKCGFDLVGDVQAAWSPRIGFTEYDAVFFAYVQGSNAQAGSAANFRLGGANNRMGVDIPALSSLMESLSTPMSRTVLAQKFIAAERIIHDQGITVGVFQHPQVTAVNKDLTGIKPAIYSPTLVWNWWEWSY